MIELKLSPSQATWISLLVTIGAGLVLLVATILFRDQQIGQLAIIGVGGAGVVALIFARPEWGIYLLIITIYTNMSTLLMRLGAPSINKPLAALILISVLTNHFFRRKPLAQLKTVEWAMILYGTIWLLSGFAATNLYVVNSRTTDFAKDVLIMLCLIWALEKEILWRRGIWILIASASGLALLSTYQVVSGNFEQTFWGFAGLREDQVITELYQNRLSGPLGDPNFYAMMLVAALPLAIYRVLDETKPTYRAIAAICCLLLVFTILNTYSRGALVATVIITTIIALERRINFRILLIVGILVLLSMQLLPEGYTARLSTLTSVIGKNSAVQNEISVRGRTSEIISGILMFVDHPIVGVGSGNYSDQYQNYAGRLGLEYRTSNRDAHSLYVEILAETGSLGILVFSWLIFSWFSQLNRLRQQLIRQRQPQEAGWVTSLIIAVIGYLSCSIFLHGDYIRYLWLYMAMGAAMIHLGARGNGVKDEQ